MNLLEKIFGTHSEREVKMLWPTVKKIESLRPEMVEKSDEELRAQTQKFRDRLAAGETLDDILPEANYNLENASLDQTSFVYYVDAGGNIQQLQQIRFPENRPSAPGSGRELQPG